MRQAAVENQDRLTDVAFWDEQYDPAAPTLPVRPRSRARRFLRKVIGPTLLGLMQDYRGFLTWDVIYPRYLPHRRGARILDVGSAPGAHLVQLHKVFGFEPYGVEYTTRGTELNKTLFQLSGLDPDHVVHADFFAPEFQAQYRGYFDVVLSRGFIEHFRDVHSVVAAHLNVLAPGGILLVTIPNLRGINYWLTWFFQKDLLAVHNLSIMTRSDFGKLFETGELTPLCCDYFGAFSFGLVYAKPHSLRGKILAAFVQLQPLLNAFFRLVFKPGRAEHRWFSSNLVFIGQKTR